MGNRSSENGVTKGPPAAVASADPASGAQPPRPISWRRRWGRRLLVAAFVLACLYLCRAPILREVGRFLIVDEPVAGSSVLILSGDRCTECAIEAYQSGSATEILLLPWHPGRLLQMGICSSFASVVRGQLRQRGLSEQASQVIPGDIRTYWEGARCLRDWLERHPGAAVTALCHEFEARKLRRILDTVLGAEYAGRVRLRALRDRRYDETDWWQSKDGVKTVFNCYLGLVHVWFYGECAEEWRPWQPEEYEKTLR